MSSKRGKKLTHKAKKKTRKIKTTRKSKRKTKKSIQEPIKMNLVFCQNCGSRNLVNKAKDPEPQCKWCDSKLEL